MTLKRSLILLACTVATASLPAQDTDGDGVPDSIEIDMGTDPNDESDYNEIIGWGLDDRKQISDIPLGIENVIQLDGGYGAAVALLSDGSVRAWGWNDACQLCVPVDLGEVQSISCLNASTIALRSDGTLKAWGYDRGGVISIPSGLDRVVQISSGESHSMALRDDGTIVIIGGGDRSAPTRWVPPDVNGNAVYVSAGSDHNLAITRDGLVRAWGGDHRGKLDVPE